MQGVNPAGSCSLVLTQNVVMTALMGAALGELGGLEEQHGEVGLRKGGLGQGLGKAGAVHGGVGTA